MKIHVFAQPLLVRVFQMSSKLYLYGRQLDGWTSKVFLEYYEFLLINVYTFCVSRFVYGMLKKLFFQ